MILMYLIVLLLCRRHYNRGIDVLRHWRPFLDAFLQASLRPLLFRRVVVDFSDCYLT